MKRISLKKVSLYETSVIMEEQLSVCETPLPLFSAFVTAKEKEIQGVRSSSTGEPWYIMIDVIKTAGLTGNVTNTAKRLHPVDRKKRAVQLPTGGNQHMWVISRFGVIHLLVTAKPPKSEKKKKKYDEILSWARTFTTGVEDKDLVRGPKIISIELTAEAGPGAEEIAKELSDQLVRKGEGVIECVKVYDSFGHKRNNPSGEAMDTEDQDDNAVEVSEEPPPLRKLCFSCKNDRPLFFFFFFVNRFFKKSEFLWPFISTPFFFKNHFPCVV
jgi:hypothetical protein